MSLGIIIKSPEGIVLAAESRVTLSTPTGNGAEMMHVNFDNATKLLEFNSPNNYVAAVTFGQAAIGVRTAHSFIPEFESSLDPNIRLSIEDFTQRLSDFYMQQWNLAMLPLNQYTGPNMIFFVAGYNVGDAYGKTFTFEIPRAPAPIELNAGAGNFGINWGGQREIVDRLIHGFDPRLLTLLIQQGLIDPVQLQAAMPAIQQTIQLNVPIQFMPLQDCVNLAKLLLKTTIDAQSLTVGIRGCGGEIDVATITKNKGLHFVKKKEISIVQK
jgi:hypothetical protein